MEQRDEAEPDEHSDGGEQEHVEEDDPPLEVIGDQGQENEKFNANTNLKD